MTMVEEVKEVRAPVWEAEVPWVVSYLREDIQDLRNEVREARRLTIESYERLGARIDARTDGLNAKIDEGLERLDAKIDEGFERLDAKIESLRRDMNVQFRWTLGTMVAVGALIVAALKFLP